MCRAAGAWRFAMIDRLDFVRMSAIPPEWIAAHMSDPRMARRMPLLTGPWNAADAAVLVASKEATWQRDGLGHWAFLDDGRYVGWGGFQKEAGEWDFGLVLRSDAFGLGPGIARKALAFAAADPRIPWVSFLLPPARRRLGTLRPLGATPVGEIRHAGTRFLKFRLETPGPGGR